MRLIANMVGQLNLHRALHQPLGQLRQNPARARDLLLAARAGQQLVKQLIRDPTAVRHAQSLTGAAAAHSPIYRPRRRVRRARAGQLLAPLVAVQRQRGDPTSSSPNPGELSNFWVLLRVSVGIAISFADAYTVPMTIPEKNLNPYDTHAIEAGSTGRLVM